MFHSFDAIFSNDFDSAEGCGIFVLDFVNNTKLPLAKCSLFSSYELILFLDWLMNNFVKKLLIE